MRISDTRFGGEVVTSTGKVRQFDSVECLANYVAAGADSPPASIWVSDFEHPGHLIEAEHARFVQRGGPGSAMGDGLLAFAPDADIAILRARFGAEAKTWSEVRAAVRQKTRVSATGMEQGDA